MAENASHSMSIEFAYTTAELAPTADAVLQRMGYVPAEAPSFLAPLILRMIDETLTFPAFRAGAVRFDKSITRFENSSIVCGDVTFGVGPVISRGMRESEDLFVFVATAGAEISGRIERYFAADAALEGFVLDTVASELVEAGVDRLERSLADMLAQEGLHLTNRYSPGYCGWDVSEQHRLFSLLPGNFIGVGLTAAAVMMPTKSASGIFGCGATALKRDYECRLCDKEHCIIRMAP